jgi:hypothetical protein
MTRALRCLQLETNLLRLAFALPLANLCFPFDGILEVQIVPNEHFGQDLRQCFATSLRAASVNRPRSDIQSQRKEIVRCFRASSA